MPAFGPASIHVDAALTSFAVKYSNRAFIGRQLLTNVPVTQLSDVFYTRSKREALQYMDNEMSHYGNAPQMIDASLTTSTFSCKPYGLEETVPFALQRASDAAINLRLDATGRLMDRLLLADEVRIASLVGDTNNYESTNRTTLVGSDQWSDANGGDPVDDMATAKSAIFAEPGARLVGWCGEDVYNKLKTNPKILDRIKYTGTSAMPARAFQQSLAELFELDDFLVGGAWNTTTALGASPTYARVWGKKAGIVAVSPRPSTMSLCFGSLFEFARPVIQSIVDMRPGLEGVEILKATHSCDYKSVAKDAGYLISDAVA